MHTSDRKVAALTKQTHPIGVSWTSNGDSPVVTDDRNKPLWTRTHMTGDALHRTAHRQLRTARDASKQHSLQHSSTWRSERKLVHNTQATPTRGTQATTKRGTCLQATPKRGTCKHNTHELSTQATPKRGTCTQATPKQGTCTLLGYAQTGHLRMHRERPNE